MTTNGEWKRAEGQTSTLSPTSIIVQLWEHPVRDSRNYGVLFGVNISTEKEIASS
jgi:hypothetical protein